MTANYMDSIQYKVQGVPAGILLGTPHSEGSCVTVLSSSTGSQVRHPTVGLVFETGGPRQALTTGNCHGTVATRTVTVTSLAFLRHSVLHSSRWLSLFGVNPRSFFALPDRSPFSRTVRLEDSNDKKCDISCLAMLAFACGLLS
jgi:hypothetical protein